jgi:hypothetical protein
MRIANKMGQEVPFALNSAQRKVSEIKKAAHKIGKPVRLAFLKWRRAGISAFESADGLAYCWANDNARVGVIAHLEERSKELLHNYKTYASSMPEWLQLETTKDNISGLRYAHNSQVLIATAENPIKVRGDGLHRVKGSEWPHWYNLFDKVMKELCPVVPPEPGSEICLEGTGSLAGSEPHDFWMELKAGQNEFTGHFLNWLEDEDSVIQVKSQYEYTQILSQMRDLEPRLVEKNKHYKLTPEQILQSWNFYFYQSKCDFDYFCREFPYREEEAWSSGGASYFGAYEIGKAKPVHPMAMFVFDEHNLNTVFQIDELRKVDKLDHYNVLPNLKIWALPQKGRMYIIGSDGSQGTTYGDFTAGYIIDAHTREDMASFHGRLRPDENAHIQVALARIYNNAICAPETNPAGGGAETMNVMQRLGYFNFYTWRVRDSKDGLRATNKIGWWTHPRSRAQMMQTLRRDFLDAVNGRAQDGFAMFKDDALLDEMRTFSSNPRSGIPEANTGCADDRVIAKGICHQVADDEVYCTSKDLIYRQHRLETSNKPIDQATLVKRRLKPDQVIDQFMGKRSNFANNKFELNV